MRKVLTIGSTRADAKIGDEHVSVFYLKLDGLIDRSSPLNPKLPFLIMRSLYDTRGSKVSDSDQGSSSNRSKSWTWSSQSGRSVLLIASADSSSSAGSKNEAEERICEILVQPVVRMHVALITKMQANVSLTQRTVLQPSLICL